mgnify:CR=1 FL=1
MKDNNGLGYRVIDTEAELASFAERLKGEERIAVDLEADSMYHFREKVCLVQMGTESEKVVIDPLRVPDLSALRPVFADPGVQKVLHGADYDIRSLYRDFRIEVEHLFDTQIACRFLGMKETGLEPVLHNQFGVALDKRFQKKDWSRRPLPQEMIDYAAMDVTHLIPLAERLESELRDRGRLEWVREECRLLKAVRYPDHDGEPLFLRFKGAGRVRPRSLAILEGLLRFRATEAERKDRPPFKIFSNKAILEIAKSRPLSVKKLSMLGVLSEKQIRMYGEGLAAVVRQGLDTPDEDLPVYPRKRAPAVHPRVPERVRMLKLWRDEKAESLSLDPSIVLNKALISAIAVRNPQTTAELAEVEEIRNWQIEAFGEAIVGVLEKTDAKKPKKKRKRRRRKRKPGQN